MVFKDQMYVNVSRPRGKSEDEEPEEPLEAVRVGNRRVVYDPED